MAIKHNLPVQNTSFIGRDAAIEAIKLRLNKPPCRLLTLVGPGGIGKTRLAWHTVEQLQSDFSDGVCVVALQAVHSIDQIKSTICNALSIKFSPNRDLQMQLIEYLRDKHFLLLLDNFEQLLDAVPLIIELLDGAPRLKIIITLRIPLNLKDEWLFHVEGLPFPQGEAIEALDTFAAVQLFVERARRARHDFSLVDEQVNVMRICQLVDGIPLAIELAAGWVKRLPCSEIVRELQRNIDILSTRAHDAPDRHRSMRAVFNQSWTLLSDDERQIMTGLSVFRGGFRREAAEQVVGADLQHLSALVDQSLLTINSDGRYQIHELQRQYAAERLAAMPNAQQEVEERHCNYYIAFMDRPLLDLIGVDSKETVDAIAADINNVNTAWHWAIDNNHALQLRDAMKSVYWFSWLRAWHEEGEKAFLQVIGALRQCEPTPETEVTLGYALTWLGAMNNWLGKQSYAEGYAEESVKLLRRLNARPELALAIGVLGWAMFNKADFERAEPLFIESAMLHEETEQYEYQGFNFNMLSDILIDRCDFVRSLQYADQALQVSQRIGDLRTVVHALNELGECMLVFGEYDQAHQYAERALVIARQSEVAGSIIHSSILLGRIATALGDIESAKQYHQQAFVVAQTWQLSGSISNTHTYMAHVFVAEGDYDRAQSYFEQAEQIAIEHNLKQHRVRALTGLGWVAFCRKDYAEALRHYQKSLSYYVEIENTLGQAKNLNAMACLVLAMGDDKQTRVLLLESLQLGIDLHASPVILEAIACAADLFNHIGDSDRSISLATYVVQHPATAADIRTRANAVLTRRKDESIESYTVAWRPDNTPTDVEVIARDVIEHLNALVEQPLIEPLSDRELEVLGYVAAGKSNREIARVLTLSLGTVKSHMHNISQKLGAANRTESVAIARQLRLL